MSCFTGHVPKDIIVKISRVEYIYLFHPRYLHNDIFRYMTSGLITLVVIATWPNFSIFCFLQLPSSSVPCSTGLEQLLKCLAGGVVALLPTLL